VKKPYKGAAAKGGEFSAEEKAAMKERARELKAAAQGADGEKEVVARIAEMPPADRAIAERIHKLVKAHAPVLTARTWYGMPAYARDGNVVCFFQSAHKFKSRYGTLGFSDKARLDEGGLWATGFAVQTLGSAEEQKIIALLKKALG